MHYKFNQQPVLLYSFLLVFPVANIPSPAYMHAVMEEGIEMQDFLMVIHAIFMHLLCMHQNLYFCSECMHSINH